jgi:anti-sigma-K factor RskA
MNMISKEPERHEIEALLPWHAAGTLNRRDADRVEQALATDHDLARQYDLVREELAETIHLNETLGAPSARAMEKLFAAIDAEEARAPRRKRSFDLASRISEFLGGFAPRTLAWSATAAALAIVLQAAVITAVLVKDRGGVGTYDVASASGNGSYVAIQFAPQATAGEITNFLGAYKATVVEAPMKGLSLRHFRVRLSETKLPSDEVNKIIHEMQAESKIVAFIGEASAPSQ